MGTGFDTMHSQKWCGHFCSLGCVKAPTQEQGQSLPAHIEANCLQKEIFFGKAVFGLSEYLAHRFNIQVNITAVRIHKYCALRSTQQTSACKEIGCCFGRAST